MNAYKELIERHTRYKKKSMESQRANCKWRSRDGSVFVCDKDGGPVRCNTNTIEMCPIYIMLKEI